VHCTPSSAAREKTGLSGRTSQARSVCVPENPEVFQNSGSVGRIGAVALV
jgi:hypothetical protein